MAACTAFGQDLQTPIKIGVLAKRGAATCLAKWGPTAEYLTDQIPKHTFVIIPLAHDDVHSAVERNEVDFILANSSFYVELEIQYGANRIATLKNSRLSGVYTTFGGVVFYRADRNDITSLVDLKGKTFMAVDETSFGGWRMAWREMKEAGIDPYRDFANLHSNPIQIQVTSHNQDCDRKQPHIGSALRSQHPNLHHYKKKEYRLQERY